MCFVTTATTKTTTCRGSSFKDRIDVTDEVAIFLVLASEMLVSNRLDGSELFVSADWACPHKPGALLLQEPSQRDEDSNVEHADSEYI